MNKPSCLLFITLLLLIGCTSAEDTVATRDAQRETDKAATLQAGNTPEAPTPTISSTATFQAPSSSTPTVTHTPTPTSTENGTILFTDDFSQPSEHWSLDTRADENASGNVSIAKGKFLVEIQFRETFIRWSRLYEDVNKLSYIELRDFDLKFNTKLLQAVPDGGVWLTLHFRINENFDSYSLRLNQKQMYSLVVRKGSVETVIKDWTFSNKIAPLTEGNSIEIIAIGSEFFIFFNGNKVDTIIDDSIALLEPGGFAIGIRSVKDSFVIAEYDDFVISGVSP